MLTLLKIILSLLFMKLMWCAAQPNKTTGNLTAEDVLNVCLISTRHKDVPNSENELIDECQPWKEKACCTPETARKLHEFNLYNFDFNMCPQKNMSEACKKYIIRDSCFYECSPNVGPWKVKSQQNNKERFRAVPLCSSDCEEWFKACADDYTCVDNWGRNYKSVPDDANICRNKNCMLIKDLYNNSASFCETIWDFFWKVVGDTEPCMKTLFKVNQNPNYAVAYKYAAAKFGTPVKPLFSNVASSTILMPKIFTILLLPFSFLCFMIII